MPLWLANISTLAATQAPIPSACSLPQPCLSRASSHSAVGSTLRNSRSYPTSRVYCQSYASQIHQQLAPSGILATPNWSGGCCCAVPPLAAAAAAASAGNGSSSSSSTLRLPPTHTPGWQQSVCPGFSTPLNHQARAAGQEWLGSSSGSRCCRRLDTEADPGTTAGTSPAAAAAAGAAAGTVGLHSHGQQQSAPSQGSPSCHHCHL